jgi:Ca2+-binding RTX toxin-like protein
MTLHETFTSDPDLAFLLGPPRPDLNLGNTWFGSVSIWGGPIIGFSPTGNPVVQVAVSGLANGVTAIQAEVFGVRTYDSTGLASVAVTHIEWSLPGSATILSRLTFPNPIAFPLSLSRFYNPPILQFVDILDEVINTFGGSRQTLFDDYFNGQDTLIGGAAGDTMHGGNSDDLLDGGAGNDSLRGDAGNDTFLFRSGDSASGDRIDGGAATDTLRVVGGIVGGINTGSGVDISAITITSIERVDLNGTEAVINIGHLFPGGFNEFVGRTGFVDQLTILNVNSINLGFLTLVNWELASDRLAVVGTAAGDSVNGSIFTDLFVGYGGQDSFNGGDSDDRMIILEGDAAPNDSFTGGAGNDVLQVESTAITTLSVTPNTDLRGMILNSVEVLDIVRGAFFVDGADIVGSIGGTNAAPVTITTGFHTVIGNDSAGTDTPIILQIEAGNLLGIDLRGTTFQDWNDGFTNNNLIRIIAGPQTQVIYGANEYSRIVAAAAAAGIYIVAGTDVDEIIGSNFADYILASGGEDLVFGQGGNDVIDAGTGHDLAYGGNGNDSMGGADGNDTVYGDLNDDFLIGGIGNDYLDGGDGYDFLNGGAGADTLVGGGLADFASYQLSATGVRADLSNAGTNTGDAAGDTYSAIEGLQGSAHGDTLVGNADGNTLRGENGADRLEGGGGSDHMVGGLGGDALYGDAGGDHLWGGADADAHYGGTDASVDYARYDDANHGSLVISLLTPASNTGAALGDTYSGIEGLVGGAGNDTVTGDTLANYLFGSGGNDQVYGGLGTDYLDGGLGTNQLWGGAGADAHIGGTGTDYARYDDANHGNLVISLAAPGSNTGAAAGDTYTGIEGLVGGLGNDTVTGDGQANILFGGGGNDFVSGGTANDTLFGEAGGDNLWGGTGADAHYGGTDAAVDYARYDEANHGNLTISLLSPGTNTGAAAGDTYVGIEGLVGGAGNDVVVGDAAANWLFGSAGNDFIDALAGNDYLNGGAGADRFRFSTALGGTNVDTIADFQVGVDDILLAQAIFAAIGPSLTADEFRIGMAADGNDYLLYNPGTGQLFYDNNASAAGGMTHFATVTINTALTATDFVMV